MIRDAGPKDAGRLLEIYSHYVENTAVTFDCELPSLAEFSARMERIMSRYPFLVLEEEGRILGYSCAGPFVGRAAYAHSAEVTVYLDHREKRKGYGRRLYTALEERLKGMGILNLYACIGDPVTEDEYLTRDSERFHLRMGYVRAGEFRLCGRKFGRWYNMIWMEKIISEHK